MCYSANLLFHKKVFVSSLLYKRFPEGQDDTDDEERLGAPTTSASKDNIENVKKMVSKNRQITILQRMLVYEPTSFGSL